MWGWGRTAGVKQPLDAAARGRWGHNARPQQGVRGDLAHHAPAHHASLQPLHAGRLLRTPMSRFRTMPLNATAASTPRCFRAAAASAPCSSTPPQLPRRRSLHARAARRRRSFRASQSHLRAKPLDVAAAAWLRCLLLPQPPLPWGRRPLAARSRRSNLNRDLVRLGD